MIMGKFHIKSTITTIPEETEVNEW
jgi:hypothetical protein